MSHSPMSRRFALGAGLGLLATLAGCGTLNRSPAIAGDETAAALPAVNALRKSRGLPALSLDPVAVRAAADQAKRMASANKMSHLIGFGDDFGKRMKAHDVKLPAAENIAAGQANTADAVTAWINSPKHLANMLGNYRGLGVAVARDPSSGNRPYWAMVLSN